MREQIKVTTQKFAQETYLLCGLLPKPCPKVVEMELVISNKRRKRCLTTLVDLALNSGESDQRAERGIQM